MRTARNAVALGSAVAGVYLLTDVRIEGEPIGVAFAFANAGLFAAYIVLAHRVAQHGRMGGIDGLGAAMLVATVVITPICFWSAAPALLDPIAVAAAVGVGISSSVIPYVFDQLAMARTDLGGLLADGLAAARHCDRDRHRRARADPFLAGGCRRVGLVVAAVAVHREASATG